MDTLTHALSGALLAGVCVRSKPGPAALDPRRAAAAGFAAAAFPDIDFALRLVDTLTYLNWHQGPTHSLVLLPAWAWLLAWAFAQLDPRRPGWRAYFAPAALGLLAHIAGDVITAYGPMLLWPLTDARFAWPLAFVLDPVLSTIIALGLAVALLARRPRAAAVGVVLALAAYGGVLAGLRLQALQLGHAYAAHHLAVPARVHDLPQPLSPRNRMIVVEAGDGYFLARVKLGVASRREARVASVPGLPAWLARIDAAYPSEADMPWRHVGRFGSGGDAALARRAWPDPAFAPFRRFAELPVLDRVERDGSRVCVWFYDLRFSFPELPPSFRFGLCRDRPADPWRLARERGAFWID